mgnify:CR=1 FL=1
MRNGGRDIVQRASLISLLIGWWSVSALAEDLSSAESVHVLCSVAKARFLEEPPIESDWVSLTASLDALQAFEQLRAQQVLRAHRVRVPSVDFRLGPYNDTLGILPVTWEGSLPIHGGASELHLQHTPEILFDVEPWVAEDLLRRHAMHALPMRLVFHVRGADDLRTPWCEEDEEGVWHVRGVLLFAELIDPATGEQLATQRTSAYEVERSRIGDCPARLLRAPRMGVEVAVIEVEQGEPLLAAHESFLREQLSLAWMPCYVQGLTTNGQLRGALVVRLRVDDRGRARSPQVVLDVANNEELAACVRTSVDHMPAWWWGIPTHPRTLRMTTFFHLEEPARDGGRANGATRPPEVEAGGPDARHADEPRPASDVRPASIRPALWEMRPSNP